MNVQTTPRPERSLASLLGVVRDQLPTRRRRQFWVVLAFMLLGAVSELVAIGAVLPFLSALSDPAGVRSMSILQGPVAWLGIDSDREIVTWAAALFAVAALGAGVVRLALTWASGRFVFSIAHDLAVQVLDRLLHQPYAFHVERNTSQIIGTIEKVQTLLFNLLQPGMQAIIASVIALFIVGVLMYIDPLTAVSAALAFALIYWVLSRIARRFLAAWAEITNAAFAKRVQVIQEAAGGIRDVIIDKSQPIYVGRFAEIDYRFRRSQAGASFIANAPRFLIETIGMVLLAVVALAISSREGGLAAALPTLGALALGAQRLLPLLQQVYYGWASWAGSRPVLLDVVETLALPVAADASTRVAPLQFSEGIRLRDVRFAYSQGSEPVLDRVNVAIPKGARVALIGRSGSGKSTLMDLLMGLLEPTGGSIEVDGSPLVGQRRRAWQATIAHVPQQIFLADSSIAANIAFGEPGEPDLDRVVFAAKQAELHDHVVGLPEGYDTMVGERGVRLSGGQRQRLGLARALYKRASVLVLDEATSALDDTTEREVMRQVYGLDRQLTVFIIAHRLSTLAGCDLVLRLDGGRIVESGTVHEVVEGVKHGSEEVKAC